MKIRMSELPTSSTICNGRLVRGVPLTIYGGEDHIGSHFAPQLRLLELKKSNSLGGSRIFNLEDDSSQTQRSSTINCGRSFLFNLSFSGASDPQKHFKSDAADILRKCTAKIWDESPLSSN